MRPQWRMRRTRWKMTFDALRNERSHLDQGCCRRHRRDMVRPCVRSGRGHTPKHAAEIFWVSDEYRNWLAYVCTRSRCLGIHVYMCMRSYHSHDTAAFSTYFDRGRALGHRKTELTEISSPSASLPRAIGRGARRVSA
jgi:hypothetical protein